MRKHGGVAFGPDAGDLLRARGLRVTPQRRAILSAFSHGDAEHLSADEIRAYRGTFTEPGMNSPWRERPVEESLDLFERMRAGEFPDGARVLRTYARLCIASVPAALLSGAACYGTSNVLGQEVLGSFAALLGGGAVLLGVFYVAARRMRIEEVNSLVGMVRGRLGR